MDPADLAAQGRASFAHDYAGARSLFLTGVEKAGAKLKSYPNPNRGPTGEELATDVAYDALRRDQWLHAREGQFDWNSPTAKTIKAEIRRAFYPDTDSWRELTLFRGRQMIRQALSGMAA